MAFDSTSPAQGHQALGDIDTIRGNCNALRENEASVSTAPPSNPVAGQLWWATDTKTMYQRNQTNSAWGYRWSEADPPAKGSDVTGHTGSNITNTTPVHGVKQGSGNGFDADTLDGQHASSFLGTSHNTASSGVHNQGSNVLLSAPSTTPFLVIASAAPTGWTQQTTWNDRVIRVVSGTGAGTGGSWTISGLATQANHTHTMTHNHTLTVAGANNLTSPQNGWYVYDTGNGILKAGYADYYGTYANYYGSGTTSYSSPTGAAGTHTHASDATWRPAYVDVIAVTKNP